MGRWRSKLLLTLIVYGAGFATAVYVLSPPEATAAGESNSVQQVSQWLKQKTAAPQTDTPNAGLEAKPWAETAHAAIGKAAAFAKTQSVLLAEAIKAKVEEHKRDRGE